MFRLLLLTLIGLFCGNVAGDPAASLGAVCSAGCTTVLGACYSASGFSLGSVISGDGLPPGIARCNSAFAFSMAKCGLVSAAEFYYSLDFSYVFVHVGKAMLFAYIIFDDMRWIEIVMHTIIFICMTILIHNILEIIVYGGVSYVLYRIYPNVEELHMYVSGLDKALEKTEEYLRSMKK